MSDSSVEKRSEPRTIVDQFYSVQFSIADIPFLFQFKIWDMSSQGMCVLVREGSDVLKHIKVGDVVNMRYYKPDSPNPTENLKTEIKHITKDENGRFRGHYLVGLSILESDNPIHGQI